MTQTPSPWLLRALLCTLLAALSACSTTSPDVVSRAEAQRLSTVVDAVVLSTRPVTVEGSQSGVGSTAGGLVGGIAASHVGGQRDAMVASVVGAVVGGVLGNIAERNVTREAALEILVQLQNGDRRAVVQAGAAETFAPGEAVMLVSTGGKVRVTKLQPAIPQASAPEAAKP